MGKLYFKMKNKKDKDLKKKKHGRKVLKLQVVLGVQFEIFGRK